jgi:uncharacterized protein
MGLPFAMARFVIPANDIDISGVAIDAELAVDWIESELGDADVHATAPGHVSARLSESGKEIVVRGRIRAEVTTPCARCLQPAPVAVDTELALLLKPAPPEPRQAPAGRRRGAADKEPAPAKPTRARKDAEYEFGAGEADVDTYDGEEVVLDGFIREAILLEMPNFPLCSESCPGIRAPALSPGEATWEPAIDPRLAPLGALRDKLQKALGGETSSAEPALPRAAKKKQRLPVSQTKAPKKKSKKKE